MIGQAGHAALHGQYRSDIDGLRAIAVGSVILFHAGVDWMQGGYLGVDVFFVISGFLIAGIITRQLEAGRFSLAEFYVRRARRILPALNVMLLLCIPVAWWAMLPGSLEGFGQSLVATTLMSNNMLLMLTAGYFDTSVHFKPLVHTWSLGVEEQYYIFVPVLLIVAFRLGARNGIIIAIAAVVALSFFLQATLHDRYPSAAFYLVVSRAWELGLGALAALCGPLLNVNLWRPRLRVLISSGALVGVLGSMSFIKTDAPPWMLLIPVLGTCALLSLGAAPNATSRLLSVRPLVGLGLISYSAYLYHQPAFAFLRVTSLEQPPVWVFLALTGPVLVVAYLSWRFIEQPFRKASSISTFSALCMVGACSAAVLAAGMSMHLSAGFPQRFHMAGPGSGFDPAENSKFNNEPMIYRDRPLIDVDKGVLIVGNSFARDFINIGLAAGAFSPEQVSYLVVSQCFPSEFTPAQERAIRNAKEIYLASDYLPHRLACLKSGLERVEAISGKRVEVIGTKNFGWNNDGVMRLPPKDRRTYRAKVLPNVIDENSAAKEAFGDRYVDLLSMITDSDGRVAVFTADGELISQDTRHVSRAGADFLAEILFPPRRLVSHQ